MRIVFAEKCGWTAVYIYNAKNRKVFHLGIDPGCGGNNIPLLFGSVNGWSYRFNLPHIPWSWVSRHFVNSPIRYRIIVKLYQASGKFWRLFDRRYFKDEYS